MAHEHRASQDATIERPTVGPDGPPPSDDSSRGLLRSSVPPPPQARVNQPVGPEPYIARLEFEPPHDDPPPRHASRQMMRWDPAPREGYDDRYNDRHDEYYDDRYDRRPYSRRSYDYAPPRKMHSDDRQRDLRLRRNVSIRDTPSRSRGDHVPPTPPSSIPRRRPEWHDPSPSDEESDEGPPKPPNRRPRAGPARGSTPPPEEMLRLPFTMWMNSSAKNHFVAAIGEFVGTTMFLFFAFAGTQVANVNASSSENTTTNQDTGFSPVVLLYIAISFGFSLMVNVWIFFRVSGGLFNPAVTLAMAMVHAITYGRACILLAMQIGGAIFSSYLVSVLFPTPFNVRTTLATGTSLVRGIFIEAVLTAELVFTIFMMAKEKHKATFMAPVAIGLALFVAELVGVFYTGGSLNPARSFGPCVVTGIFDQEHWIYWLGPAVGAVAAVLFYRFIKILEYEVANPGQDEASEEEAADAATPKKETV